MLTKLINDQVKATKKGLGYFASFRNLFSDLYLPNLHTFFVVAFAVIIFFLFSQVVSVLLTQHFEFAKTILEPLSSDANHYQNLIAIHAGIGTVIFALVIFVAESMRDDESDRSRVLLKVSYLFPLTVAEILVFFFFIWFDANVISIVPILLTGLAAIFSLKRIVDTQLNKYLFMQKRTEMVKGRVKQSIDLAIKERIGKTYC